MLSRFSLCPRKLLYIESLEPRSTARTHIHLAKTSVKTCRRRAASLLAALQVVVLRLTFWRVAGDRFQHCLPTCVANQDQLQHCNYLFYGRSVHLPWWRRCPHSMSIKKDRAYRQLGLTVWPVINWCGGLSSAVSSCISFTYLQSNDQIFDICIFVVICHLLRMISSLPAFGESSSISKNMFQMDWNQLVKWSCRML